jgi:hypothetical protein
MKLAEALALRSDLQTQLVELGKRLQQNARYQEGEEPAEDAAALLAQVDRITVELETLIVQVNVRNLATEVEPGVSMTAALARRDSLKMRHRQRIQLAEAASTPVDRYSRTELRSIAAVNVRALRDEIDDLARQIRELDTRIQGVNWTTEL